MAASSSSSSSDVLAYHQALLSRVAARREQRSSVVPPSSRSIPTAAAVGSLASASSSSSSARAEPPAEVVDLTHVPAQKRAKVEALYPCYRWDEETVRNDLPARYAITGEWGGNFIAGADESKRFDEYPRSKKLLRLKKELQARHAHPPLFLPLASASSSASPPPPTAAPGASPSTLSSSSLLPVTGLKSTPHSDVPPSLRPFNSHLLAALGQTRFDSILITPPPTMSWEEVAALPVRQISADPSFVYLWVGEGGEGGLEKGREALARWGFRRCEEIVWVKTNRSSVRGPGTDVPTDSIFQNTKQHCLMGIRGTVRRATDGWLVHTNIDTDIIVWEGDKDEPHAKPPELYSLAENFSMGTRRLDLFGSRSRPRKGWVTAGWDAGASAASTGGETTVDRLEGLVEVRSEDDQPGVFDKDAYETLALVQGRYFYPTPQDIESLRPKSPVRNGSGPSRPHSSQKNGTNSGSGGPGNRPYTPSASTALTSSAYSTLPPTPYTPQPQMTMGMQGMMGYGVGYGMAVPAFMQPQMGVFGMGMTQPNGMQGMFQMGQMGTFGGGMQQQQQQQSIMTGQLHYTPYGGVGGQQMAQGSNQQGAPSSSGNAYGGGSGHG